MADPIPGMLNVLIEHTPTSMAIVEGKSLRFRWCNPAYRQCLDEPFRTRGVAGVPYAQVFPDARASGLEALLRRVIAERSNLTFPEYEYRGLERGVTYWHLNIMAIAAAPGADDAIPDVLIQGYEVTDAVVARKNAERLAAELRAANERWELVVRGTEDGIWDWDIVNNVVYWSPRTKEMLGYADHELEVTRDAVRDLIHPDDRGPAWASVRQQLEAGSDHYRGEYRLRHRDGHYRWVLARGLVVRDSAGTALRIVGSHVDITEHRRSEEALRKSREQLLGIINNSPAMIFVKDLEGRYLLVNEPFNRGAGVSDAGGLSDADLFDPPTAARVRADDGQVLASRAPRTIEETITYRSRTMHFLTTKFPLAGSDGQPYALCGIATEVTALKQAEEKLRESEEYHRQFLENLPQMAWTCRADGHCDYLSPQWMAYTGGTMDDALGTGWQQAIHPEDRPAAARAWTAGVEGRAPYDVEYRLRSRDGGYRWFHARGTLFRDAAGRPVRWFGTTTDVHDRRTALEQLRISEARFRLFAQSSVMGILFADPAGGISYANDEYLRIVGRTRREIGDGSLRWDTITPPEWLDRDRQALAEADRKGQCVPYEKEYVRPDGTRVPVLIGFVLGGADRQEATAFVLDLTEQKRTSAALRESEQRLQIALEAGRMGTWEWTIADGRVAWSPTLEKIHGRLPGTFKGTFEDVLADVHPDDRAALASAVQNALTTRTNHHVTYRILTHDGRERWVEAHGTLLCDADGNPQRMVGVCADVTERRQAEESVRESEQLLRVVTDTLPSLMAYINRDEKYVFNNRAYEQWVKIPREQLRGKSLRDMPIEYATIADHVATALSGRTVNFQRQITYPDGITRHVDVTYSPDTNPAGVVQGFAVLVNDVSQLRRTEDALRASQERWRLAVQGTNDGIWDHDLLNDAVYWSPRCKEMLGYADDALQMSVEMFRMLIHPEDREATHASYARHRDGASPQFMHEYRLLHRDGSYRWILARGMLVRNAQGAAVRMVGSHTDITGRRAIEDRLRSSEGRLQVALDTADLALWDIDLTTGAVTESDRLIALFGLPAGTRHQRIKDWGRYVHPDDQARLAEAYQKALTGQGDYVAEHRVLGADGRVRWVSSRGRVVAGANGAPLHMIGVSADVTAQKLSQADLEHAKEAAEAANSAKDRFLAVLSHELRTPLTPVVMTLAALDMDENVAAATKQDLALVRRNIELETQLIDDLLDVTRIANGKLRLTPRPVRVHELLEHVCTICEPDARSKHIALRCHLEAPADLTHADPARLEQVFWNLVKNAIKFTPEGGRVDVSTLAAAEGAIEVTVRDSGVGISPEVKERIFNAFEQGEQTVTRTFGGLGLGLAISKAIVDLHAGKIWADSDGKGAGATFHVLLPLRTQADGERQHPQQSPGGAGRREKNAPPLRVLLVDDHADTVRVMERLLTALGMRVTTAGSVESALGTLRSAEVDLLISDIGLPDGTGHELIVQAHRARPGLPAIALSGFGMDADVRRSLDAGFFTHLTKPVSPERLQGAITAAMGSYRAAVKKDAP
jgi:PAS domain S-box-containing protein